jgi:dCMP deaminase
MSQTPPREVPDRDVKYMALAFCIAHIFSKDPNTQVGAIIIDGNNVPRGWGYNGPPRAIDDEDIDWSRPSKYKYIKHAESNAIQHSHGSLQDSTIYITAPPCKKCIIDIISAEIDRVVYYKLPTDNKSSVNDDEFQEVQEIAAKSKIQLEEFKGNLNYLQDAISNMAKIGIFV